VLCSALLCSILSCRPQLLLNLAERAKLRTKMNAMFAGEHINNTEDRAVLHTALRMPRDEVRLRPYFPQQRAAWGYFQGLD
jgi:glucose-6-phosphate isomerase